MLRIVTKPIGDITPFKTLNNIPDWCTISDKSNSGVRIIDMGSLMNVKRFMNNAPSLHPYHPSEKISSNGWSGSYDWKEYLNLLDNGDETVIGLIRDTTKASVKEFEKKYKEVVTNYKFDVTGQFFDVGLVVTGVPETWLQPEPEEQEIVRIEINIDIGMLSDVDYKEVQRNGGRICGMVKVLEDHGVEVKIRLTNAVAQWGGVREILVVSFIAKDFDEPINYEKLSSVLTPTYLRRGAFKLREVLSKGNEDVGRTVNMGNNYIKLSERRQVNELEKRLFKQGE